MVKDTSVPSNGNDKGRSESAFSRRDVLGYGGVAGVTAAGGWAAVAFLRSRDETLTQEAAAFEGAVRAKNARATAKIVRHAIEGCINAADLGGIYSFLDKIDPPEKTQSVHSR